MTEKREPSKKYYTDEHPGGPWSRALYEKRTGKPFNEEEFRKDFEDSKKKRALDISLEK